MLILRNQQFSVKHAKMAIWGSSRAPEVPMERFSQNYLVTVGRPHPLETILKTVRKVIKPIWRNGDFNVKTCKMDNWGPLRAPGVPMERSTRTYLAIPWRYHPIEAYNIDEKKISHQ